MMPRGRRSDADAARVVPFIPGAKPPAPPELDADEADVWDTVVASVPANWIPGEAWAMLKEYCRHTVFAERLSADIARLREEQAVPPPDLPADLTAKQIVKVQRDIAQTEIARRKELRALLRAHGFQTSRMQSLGTKLRLTVSSRILPEKARDDRRDSSSSPVKPWNDWRGGRQ
jgi:hypothetical protein